MRNDGAAKRPFSRKVENFLRQLKVLSGQVEVIFGHPFEPIRQHVKESQAAVTFGEPTVPGLVLMLVVETKKEHAVRR